MSATLIAIAVAPIFLFVTFFYLKDKHKEPWGKLLKALGLGALIIIPAGILEAVVEPFLKPGIGTSAIEIMLYAFIGIALIEEGVKFIVLFKYFWNEKELDEFYDALIYAVFISLGFALVENIFYTIEYGKQTAVVRAFTAIPSHVLDGVFMGIFLGLAKFIYPESKWIYIFLALIVPMITHGLYDGLLMLGTAVSVTMALLSVVVGWLIVPKIIRYTQSVAT